MKTWHGAALLLLGCAGGETKQATAPNARAQVLEPKGLSRPDVSEAQAVKVVRMPGDSDVSFHFEAPLRDLPVLSTFELADSKMNAVLQQPEVLVGAVAGETIAASVDLARPVDALMGVNGRAPVWSVAFTPKVDQLAGLELERVGPGRWLIVREEAERKTAARRCELWHGEGRSGYRILCSDFEERLDLHGPYYLGESARQESGANVRLQIAARLFADAMKKNAKAPDGATAAERAGERLGQKLMFDFVGEQESMGLELRLKPRAIELALDLSFESTRSPFALWWTGAGGKPGVSPSFYKLPVDAETSFFKGGAGAAEMARAGQPLFDEALRVMLEDYVLSDAERSDFAKMFRGILPRGGAASFAFGQDREQIRAALEAVGERSSPSGDQRASTPASRKALTPKIAELKTRLSGWVVVGLDEEPLAYIDSVRSFLRFSGKSLKKKVLSKAEKAEKAADEKADEKVRPSDASFKLGAAPAKLPKGSLYVVRSSRPNPRYQPPADGSAPPPIPDRLHFYVVPDGDRVWIAISADPEVAIAHVLAVLGSGGARSAELTELAGKAITAFGTSSIASLVSLALEGDSANQRQETARTLTELARLPHRGEARIPIWMELEKSSEPARKDAVSSRLVARLSPEAVADLVALVRFRGAASP